MVGSAGPGPWSPIRWPRQARLLRCALRNESGQAGIKLAFPAGDATPPRFLCGSLLSVNLSLARTTALAEDAIDIPAAEQWILSRACHDLARRVCVESDPVKQLSSKNPGVKPRWIEIREPINQLEFPMLKSASTREYGVRGGRATCQFLYCRKTRNPIEDRGRRVWRYEECPGELTFSFRQYPLTAGSAPRFRVVQPPGHTAQCELHEDKCWPARESDCGQRYGEAENWTLADHLSALDALLEVERIRRQRYLPKDKRDPDLVEALVYSPEFADLYFYLARQYDRGAELWVNVEASVERVDPELVRNAALLMVVAVAIADIAFGTKLLGGLLAVFVILTTVPGLDAVFQPEQVVSWVHSAL